MTLLLLGIQGFDGCNVFISALELSTFKMPSNGDLPRSISELKRVSFWFIFFKRELAQEYDDALKKLKKAIASVSKF